MLYENVEEAIAIQLRRRGIDATTVKFEDMTGTDDPDVLAYATTHGRVVVSYDDDFIKLAKLDIEHAGIIFIPFPSRDIGYIVLTHARLAKTASDNEMKNMLRNL